MTTPTRKAVLFADVAGSTRLYERLGDRAALSRIGACLQRLAGETASGGGRVIKTIGDELMCGFHDPVAALLAAMKMQSVQASAGDGLALRCGFHFGEVIERDADLFGDTVNVAARVAALATQGQILATMSSLESLPAYLRPSIRSLGPVGVRGKEQPLALGEILWDLGADLTVMAGQSTARSDALRQTLVLEHGGRRRELSGSRDVLTFGRAESNDLVVDVPQASRTHARVEARACGFVLVDMSSNGTFVAGANSAELVLRREEMLLQGSGALGPGARVNELPCGGIRFALRA